MREIRAVSTSKVLQRQQQRKRRDERLRSQRMATQTDPDRLSREQVHHRYTTLPRLQGFPPFKTRLLPRRSRHTAQGALP